jgi:hypothetical protein
VVEYNNLSLKSKKKKKLAGGSKQKQPEGTQLGDVTVYYSSRRLLACDQKTEVEDQFGPPYQRIDPSPGSQSWFSLHQHRTLASDIIEARSSHLKLLPLCSLTSMSSKCEGFK